MTQSATRALANTQQTEQAKGAFLFFYGEKKQYDQGRHQEQEFQVLMPPFQHTCCVTDHRV